jgi:hypothetical protein
MTGGRRSVRLRFQAWAMVCHYAFKSALSIESTPWSDLADAATNKEPRIWCDLLNSKIDESGPEHLNCLSGPGLVRSRPSGGPFCLPRAEGARQPTPPALRLRSPAHCEPGERHSWRLEMTDLPIDTTDYEHRFGKPAGRAFWSWKSTAQLQVRSRPRFRKCGHRQGPVPRAGINRGDLPIYRRGNEAGKWSKMQIEGGEDANVD